MKRINGQKMMKMMTKTIFTIGLLAMLISLPAFGASANKSVKIEAGSEASGATSVNGSVSVGENAVVSGGVKTVNGAVRVDSGATIGNASTVNGSVKIASNVRADNLSTVNGSISVGESSTVNGDIEAVNGRITVENGTTVGDNVGNVNGQIELLGADVGGDVSTVNGDVRISDGTVVKGDVTVEKPNGWSWGKEKSRLPRVVIGPGSTVEGIIELEREVELFISETASVGGVSGVMTMDDAVRFSGENP
jgi:DUF4097 and DUF4098 domain-containing protein YvlB